MTEDEMVGWHRGFDGLESQQALGVGDGQGSLVCCSPWGCTELCRELCQALLTKMQAWPQPPLFVPQAWTWDEGVRPCDSDLIFPLLS